MRILSQAFARLLCRSGVYVTLRRKLRHTLWIAHYRRVLTADDRDALPIPDVAVTPQTLAEHLAFFAKNFVCLPLTEAVPQLRQSAEPRPLLCLAFDGGYVEDTAYILEALRTAGVRATFFVPTTSTSLRTFSWCDQLARALVYLQGLPPEHNQKSNPVDRLLQRSQAGGRTGTVTDLLKTAQLMDADTRATVVDAITKSASDRGWKASEVDQVMDAQDLRDLVAAGHEIGVRARHDVLSLRTEASASLRAHRATLESIVGASVISWAYPDEDRRDHVAQVAGEAGFQYGVTAGRSANRPVTDPLRLAWQDVLESSHRRPTGEFDPAMLANEWLTRTDGTPRS